MSYTHITFATCLVSFFRGSLSSCPELLIPLRGLFKKQRALINLVDRLISSLALYLLTLLLEKR